MVQFSQATAKTSHFGRSLTEGLTFVYISAVAILFIQVCLSRFSADNNALFLVYVENASQFDILMSLI